MPAAKHGTKLHGPRLKECRTASSAALPDWLESVSVKNDTVSQAKYNCVY